MTLIGFVRWEKLGTPFGVICGRKGSVGCGDAEGGGVGISSTITVGRKLSSSNKLFIPRRLPALAASSVGGLVGLSCIRGTACVLGRFLASCVIGRMELYTSGTCSNAGFRTEGITPIIGLGSATCILRL